MRSTIRSAVLILALSAAGFARAQATGCTGIAALPFTITAPGIYCLDASLASTDPNGAIAVEADDVVIDLKDRVLEGSPAGPDAQATGVRAHGRKRITVRNGTIRGFYRGVDFTGADAGAEGHLVENVRFDRNTTIAAAIEGKGAVLRNNTVLSTQGSSSTATRGLQVFRGHLAQISDNEVLDTVEKADGTAIAIHVADSAGVVVERNVVANAAHGPAMSYGIAVVGGGQAVVVDNHVLNVRRGISFDPGVTGIYAGNTVGGATTAFTGGTASGLTNFSF
jgi:hypothetical protein